MRQPAASHSEPAQSTKFQSRSLWINGEKHMSAISVEFPTLDQLAAEAGDDTMDLGRDSKGSSGPYVSPFEVNKAYPVEITAEQAGVNRFGGNETQISLAIVKPDNTLRNAGRDWVRLPVLTAEKKAEMSPEDAAKAVKDAGKNLHSLLRAASGDGRFDIYARSEKSGKNWKFFDKDGNEISAKDKKVAELAMGKAVIGVAKLMLSGQKFLTGKRCYVVRTASKTNPNKFFFNYFSEQPTSYELGEVK